MVSAEMDSTFDMANLHLPLSLVRFAFHFCEIVLRIHRSSRSRQKRKGTANAVPRIKIHLYLGLTRSHPVQRSRDVSLHVATMNDGIDHSFLHQELTSLEAFGQLLPNRLFNHARSRESDQCTRFTNIQIAQHRE